MKKINERRANRFARGLADHLFANEPELLMSNDGFARWLTDELRSAQTIAERTALEWSALERARRICAKARARRLEKELPALRLPLTDAPIGGTPSQVREYAGRRNYAPCLTMPVAAGVGRALWDEPCESWVELPATLPRGDYFALEVHGDSMTPLIRSRERILVKSGSSVVEGTVIVANRNDDGTVVKYVSSVRGDVIELASLNPNYESFTIRREPHSVAGTVIARIRTD